MPNLKEDNPQFPERTTGSFLKAAVAATPLAIGVTAAMRGVATDGTIKQPREAGIDQAMRVLSQHKYKGPPIPGIEEVNRFMNKQSGDVARQAWKWATQTVDPFTRKRLLTYTGGIEGMSEAEIRSAISQTIAGNESEVMSRIWRRFQRNVSLLETQQTLSGGLPAFTPVEDLTQFAQRRTIPLSAQMPSTLASRVQRIAQKLGATPDIYGFTRPEVAAEGFGAWNVIFKGTPTGDIKLHLPQIVSGVMLEGSDLQTRRIAPDVLHIGIQDELTRMGRTEFFLKEFEESIMPDIGGRLKTQRDVEEAVKQLKGKVFGELETTPNVLIEGRTAAQAQREALRGKAIDIVKAQEVRRGRLEYQPSFRQPTREEVTRLMMSEEGKGLGLRGGIGPKGLSKGRLSMADWERFYLGPVDYSRRPEQKFREFQATEETLQRLGQQRPGQRFRALQMVGDEIAYQNVALPKLKATYIDPERHGELLERFAMGEGEVITRANKAGMLEFEQSTTAKLMEARSDIGDFSKIKPGEVLGLTPEGRPFTLPKDASITHVRRLTDNALQVEYLRRFRLTHGGKIFGAAKAVALFLGAGKFADLSRRLGIGDQATDMFISMDELRKNRSLHKTQIISGLEDLIRTGWDRSRGGAPGTGLARKFYLGQGEAIGRAWAKTGTHEDFIRRAMQAAIGELDLSAKEFGQIFGAVPFVLKDPQAAARLAFEAGGRTRQVRRMVSAMTMSGTAGGVAEIAFGGPRLDVGGLGSLEPRAFDILKGGAFGKEGAGISAELMHRLAVTNPEAVIASQELQKTMQSMLGQRVSGPGRTYKFGTSFQQFVEAGGGFISPGKGLGDIYVPGADVMQAMRPFETATGATVRGAASKIYGDIAYQAGLFREGQLTQQEFEREMQVAADLIRREWAPGGKGIGAVTRGKVLGSRFLRGVSSMGSAESAVREAYTVGITEQTFMDMYDELARSNLYTDRLKELESMKNRFIAGQNVGGMLTRHPFIGEYSLQPILMKRVEGPPDLMVLPEIKQNIRLRTALQREFEEKTLTLGPLVGLAGDKDADAYSAMLLGPDNEKAIRKRILAADSKFAQRYAQHQVRMQAFKAGKAPPSTLPAATQMVADVEKLAVGQEWIGRLSLELSEAKRALTSFGRGAPAADARFILEWAEQNLISAKHMRSEDVFMGGLEAQITSIVDTIREREAVALESNLAQIVKDDSVAKSMLTDNVHIDARSAQELSRNLNMRMGTELQGVNIRAATKELMRSLSESDTTGMTRQGQLLAGRGARAKQNEMMELAAKGAFRSTGDGAGLFSKVSTAFGEGANLLARAGKGIMKHHKAIGFGFAGSVALAAALSAPPQVVGSGQDKIPDARLNMNRRKAANRMKPEDVQAPQQGVGQPTAPQLVANQNVRMTMNQPRTSVHGKMRLPANANVSATMAQLGSLGENTSVNLRDSRKTLQPYEIANKLL